MRLSWRSKWPLQTSAVKTTLPPRTCAIWLNLRTLRSISQRSRQAPKPPPRTASAARLTALAEATRLDESLAVWPPVMVRLGKVLSLRQEIVDPAIELPDLPVEVSTVKGDHLHHFARAEDVVIGKDELPLGQEVIGTEFVAGQSRQPHDKDHQCTAQPQPVGRGDNKHVDVITRLDVVHGQRARHRHHAHERQAGQPGGVAAGRRPHLLRNLLAMGA